MEQIKNQFNSESTSLYSIRMAQGHRLFDLIQQNIPQPTLILSRGNLGLFLSKYVSQNLEGRASKLLQQLKRDGLDINSEQFAAGYARYLDKVELTNEQSLIQLYTKAKQMLSFTYQKPREEYERWDIDTDGYLPEQLNIRKNNIQNFYQEAQLFNSAIDNIYLQNNLGQINYCLTVLSISENQNEIFPIYKTFMVPSIMNHISEFLSTISKIEISPSVLDRDLIQNILKQKQSVANFFALIAHFYSACKYSELKERLETYFLFYNETFKTMVMALQIPQSQIQSYVSINLCMMSNYIPSFNQWILSDMSNNLQPILNQMSIFSNVQATFYSLFFLKKILKDYQKTTESFKNEQINQQILVKMQTQCLKVLQKYNDLRLQKECILVIAEILKVCPIYYQQIEDLKIITNIFAVQYDYQVVLLPAALAILQVSIHRKIVQITNMIINDPGFLICLKNNFGVKQSIFYYQYLHIIYLLSYDHISYLHEKNLLSTLLEMMYNSTTNPTVLSIASDVLLNAVQQALQNQEFLRVIYEKYFIIEGVLPFIFKRCFVKPEYLDLLLQQNNMKYQYSYFDKYMLNNFFKILYSLALGVSRKNKKYSFLKKVNEKIIKLIAQVLNDLVKQGNPHLIETVLREKLKISNSKKFKLQQGLCLFKLISFILEELTFYSCKDNQSASILRTINRLVISYGRNLLHSSVFTLHELEIENIPLFIQIIIKEGSSVLRRFIPYKTELKQIKFYAKKFLEKNAGNSQSFIRNLNFQYIENKKRVVQNQVQYRNILNKAFENKKIDFIFQINHVDWVEKRFQERSNSFINTASFNHPRMRQNQEPNTYTTSRGSNNWHGHSPDLGNRQNNFQQWRNQQNDYMRKNYSPHHVNYTYSNRGTSPKFGGGSKTTRNI